MLSEGGKKITAGFTVADGEVCPAISAADIKWYKTLRLGGKQSRTSSIPQIDFMAEAISYWTCHIKWDLKKEPQSILCLDMLWLPASHPFTQMSCAFITSHSLWKHLLMGGPCRELNPWSLPPLTPDSIRRGTLSTGPHTLCVRVCVCTVVVGGKAGINLLIVPSWAASFHYRISDPTSWYWKQTHAWLWWLLQSNPWLWQRCAEAQTQGCRFVCPPDTHNTQHTQWREDASEVSNHPSVMCLHFHARAKREKNC